MRARQAKVFLLCLLAIQASWNCSFAPAALALDLDNMVKESIKTQFLPLQNQGQNLNPVQQAPIKVERQTQKLQDIIPRQDIPYSYPPMIPLQGISISGLGSKAIASLGENYFVVKSNSGASKMSELYRENRLAGKANYVTIDCILHPYFAYRNRIGAELIKRQLMPLIKTLLLSMLRVAVSDHKQSDDPDVKADIESNMAFICLPLKLMDPAFQIPAFGRVAQMVQADYDSVVFARSGHSAVFERNEDFQSYRPQGWYKSSPELINFYRIKTWLSHLNYPINDVTFDNGGIRANNFRRSVLLYRCIDLARIDGKPAYDHWTRLVKGMFLLGSKVEHWQERNLYCHDYKTVFKTRSTDLKVTLTALSEPLYRTKLLLAVRKQKPLSLGSTSIFDLEDQQLAKESGAAFRLIPEIGYPEDPWIRYAAKLYPKPGVSTNIFPVALLDLNAWGAGQAGNFLLDSSWAMDESMPRTVSELKRWVLRRALGGQVQPVECTVWNILSPSWILIPDGIQTALRCEMWANRRLETAFCGWLDSRLAIAPPHIAASMPAAPANTKPSAKTNAEESSSEENKIGEALSSVPEPAPQKPAASSHKAVAASMVTRPQNANSTHNQNTKVLSGKAQAASALQTTKAGPLPHAAATPPGSRASTAGATNGTAPASASNSTNPTNPTNPAQRKVKPYVARRAARSHFLDPYPEFYNRLLLDTQQIEKEHLAQGFPLEPNLKRGLDDFARLFQRFVKIAKNEVEGINLVQEDLNLLANIDMILEKIDLPLANVFHVNALPEAGSTTQADPSAGFTMALGRPGLLYIILMNKNTKEWTLARGAVYTYYEQYGTEMNEESLISRIDRGAITTPYWTERFDFLQAEKK